MMWETILNWLVTLGLVVGLFVEYYFNVKKNLQNESVNLINNAEGIGGTGEEKMAMVVDRLYSLVPNVFKVFIKKSTIKKIAQKVFDEIEAYAKKQGEAK